MLALPHHDFDIGLSLVTAWALGAFCRPSFGEPDGPDLSRKKGKKYRPLLN